MTSVPVDSAGHSPFRAAVENKDLDSIATVLAAEVDFRSPVVFASYHGRETVAGLLGIVGEVLLPHLVYQWQVHDGDREVLCFTTQVDGREVEGVDLLRYDENGKVAELVVMMRPASGLAAVRDAIAARLQGHEPAPAS